MFSKLTSVLSLTLIFFVVTAHAVRSAQRSSGDLDTNAKRFARGLPPMAPKKLRRKGTPVVAKRVQPSQIPLTDYKGRIEVRKKDAANTLVGYISSVLTSPGGIYTVDASITKAVEVTFTAPSTGAPSNLDLYDNTNKRSSTPYIGGASTQDIGPNSSNGIPLAGVPKTTAGASPTTSSQHTNGAGPTGIESAIWKFDTVTKEITSKWVSTSGSTLDQYLMYNPSGGNSGLYITGDVGRFTLNRISAYEVKFVMVYT